MEQIRKKSKDNIIIVAQKQNKQYQAQITIIIGIFLIRDNQLFKKTVKNRV